MNTDAETNGEAVLRNTIVARIVSIVSTQKKTQTNSSMQIGDFDLCEDAAETNTVEKERNAEMQIKKTEQKEKRPTLNFKSRFEEKYSIYLIKKEKM